MAHTCTCGATLQYRQDMVREPGGRTATWKCTDCLTPVPATVAERLKHQHPV
jgi:hypothetical protein